MRLLSLLRRRNCTNIQAARRFGGSLQPRSNSRPAKGVPNSLSHRFSYPPLLLASGTSCANWDDAARKFSDGATTERVSKTTFEGYESGIWKESTDPTSQAPCKDAPTIPFPVVDPILLPPSHHIPFQSQHGKLPDAPSPFNDSALSKDTFLLTNISNHSIRFSSAVHTAMSRQRISHESRTIPLPSTVQAYSPPYFSGHQNGLITSSLLIKRAPILPTVNQDQRRNLQKNTSEDKPNHTDDKQDTSNPKKATVGGDGTADGGSGEKTDPTTIVRSFATINNATRRALQWNLYDLLAVTIPTVIFIGVLLAPPVSEQMRKSQNTYDEVEVDVAFQRAVTNIYKGLQQEQDDGGSGTVSGVALSDLVADLLRSETLQAAITSVATRVIQSPKFQEACKSLVKTLWKDLVEDPETTAQVVQLLHNAIRNEEVLEAVKELISKLCEDPEIRDELSSLVQRLGQEEKVQEATQHLITESAHKTLSDPEIREHSMEFATDVVGDDVVQRTSGEALRNTVRYAAQPVLSAFLSVTGIGLVIFSFAALSRVSSSKRDGEAFDAALASMARSMQEKASYGGSAVLRLPMQLLGAIWSGAGLVLSVPLAVVRVTASGGLFLTNGTYQILGNTASFVLHLPGMLLEGLLTGSDVLRDSVAAMGRGLAHSSLGRLVINAPTTIGAVRDGAWDAAVAFARAVVAFLREMGTSSRKQGARMQRAAVIFVSLMNDLIVSLHHASRVALVILGDLGHLASVASLALYHTTRESVEQMAEAMDEFGESIIHTIASLIHFFNVRRPPRSFPPKLGRRHGGFHDDDDDNNDDDDDFGLTEPVTTPSTPY